MPIYATSLIMFALPISMPRFKSINFYQNIPKIKLFLQKNAQVFVCWMLRSQTPVPPAAGGFSPKPPKQPPPPLRISGYAPGVFIAVMLFGAN